MAGLAGGCEAMKQDCGCKVQANVGVTDWGRGDIDTLTWIRYCPMHQAAGKMQKALKTLVGWLEHGLPQVPHEGSHTPESGCDAECMNEAQFSEDMGEAMSALTASQKLDKP